MLAGLAQSTHDDRLREGYRLVCALPYIEIVPCCGNQLKGDTTVDDISRVRR